MHPVDYFAYGSNMSERRLAARVSIATVRAVGFLRGYALRFHKVGRDGSGKCDACLTGNDRDQVHGVVFRLDAEQLARLDDYEDVGVGYRRESVPIETADGDRLVAETYLALCIDPTLRPFDWYKAHVLDGARAAGLPDHYVRMIERLPALSTRR